MNNRKRVQRKALLSDEWRSVIAITVSIAVLAVCAGSLTLLSVPPENVTAFRILQIIFFTAMGCWQAAGRSGRLMPLVRNGIDGRLAYTVAVGILIALLLSILYLFTDKGRILIGVTSAACFVLPFLLVEQWNIITGAKEIRYDPWQISTGKYAKQSQSLSETITVRIKIITGYFDESDTLLIVNHQPEALLGSAFSDSLTETSEKNLEEVAASRQQYSWEFYRENPRVATRVYFDPEKSFTENNIRDRSLIMARRVKQIEPRHETSRQ